MAAFSSLLPIGAGGLLRDPFQDYGTVRKTADGAEYAHKGCDISGGDGKSYPVISPVTGIVVESRESPSFWPAVVTIQAADGYYHRFGHLAPDSLPPLGSVVTQWQSFARISSTDENERYRRKHPGRGHMGAHVHYEISTAGPTANPAAWPGAYRDPAYFLKTGKYSQLRATGRKYPMRFSP